MSTTTESLLQEHSDACKALSNERPDVEQAIHYYKEFLTDMLEEVSYIRCVACRGDKDIPMVKYGIDFDLTDGLCYNLRVLSRVYPMNIRIIMRTLLSSRMNYWPDGSGYLTYPVPSFNACTPEEMFEFSINSPKIMWGEGAYADARWNLVRYLAGAL